MLVGSQLLLKPLKCKLSWENNVRNFLSNVLSLGMVAGIIGFAVYFFGFGQTFEGEVCISAENDEPGTIGGRCY